MPPTFVSLGWYWIKGHGWVAVVENDQERPRDNPGLEGREVIIDGETFMCTGVERRLPLPPISKGELIGLLVTELKK